MDDMKKNRGFTLIELLVVLAILTIIGSIAYPLYSGYQKIAARSEAQTNLSALALCLDEYFVEEGTYLYGTDTATKAYTWTNANNFKDAGGHLNNCFRPRKGSGGKVPKYDYSLSVTAANAYTATADGARGLVASDDDLTLDDEGNKEGPWPE